jgi:cobalt-zinc-cadmium efflux system outer membrane protein
MVGLAAACLAGGVWAQSQPPSAQAALLETAIRNNRDLLAVRQRAEEARGLLRQAGVRPAPVLETSGTTGRPLGTRGEEQFSAALSQTVLTAGKRSKRMLVAEKQLALAEVEYAERLRQLRFEIRARYADYSAESDRLRIICDLQQTYRRSLELLKARVEQGDAAALERDLLSVELTRTGAQRAVIQGRLLAARADLARLVGVPDPAAVDPPINLTPAEPRWDLSQLKQRALTERPDLRAAEFIRQQEQAQGELAMAENKADFTVSAGYSRVYSRFDDQFGLTPGGLPATLRDRDDLLTVGVSIPLFTRGRNLGNVEAAAARTRGAQHRREYLAQSIPLEVESAWARLTAALQAYQTLDQAVLRQSARNLEVIEGAYRLGQLRLLDVLNEQRRLLDTQLSTIDSKLEVLRGLAELEKAVGGELQ